jgi:hypothetical protein
VTREPIDIGHGVSIEFTTWGDHDPAGLIETHVCKDGKPTPGGVMFDLPGVREAFPGRALWTVENLDPLTIHPSVMCSQCGHHGWIKAGRWEPC